MKLTHRQLRSIIQEELVLELELMMPPEGGGGYRPAPGLPAGQTPFPAARDPDLGPIPPKITMGAEILLGFTPAGIVIDFKDLAQAIEERDPVFAVMAGIGFFPVAGDLFKVPYKAGRASAKQVKALDKIAKELGPDGIEQLGKRGINVAQDASKVSRAIRISEPVIHLDINDDFRKAAYNVIVDGADYVVTLAKRSHGAPVDVSFNVPGAEVFKMTGKGNVMRIVDGVFDTVKDFSKRFPDEKSFSFSGAVQGGPRPAPGEATKRARVFSALLQRKIMRDPELATMVKKIGDASWAGDANTWKITLHELRRIIQEVLTKKTVAGSYPDESYEEGTVKNLMLDKETSHGGWPDGPSRSFTSNEPVNQQIAKWLKDMKMVKK
jgi:hypothetical protein